MDDDYVAEVLAREARDTSRKYQTEGLAAYMPRRPTNDAPKPNTRFLRHLIKESESHNSALKRKEEKEARDRLRHLHGRPEERPVSKLAPSSQKSRDVPAGTSAADRKRRDEHLDRSRQDETEGSRSQRRHRPRESSLQREKDHSRRSRPRDDHSRSSRASHGRRDGDRLDLGREKDRRERRTSHDGSGKIHHSRSRSRSPRRDSSSGSHRRDRHRHRHRSRSRSRSGRRSRSPSSRYRRLEHRSEHVKHRKDRIGSGTRLSPIMGATDYRDQPTESSRSTTVVPQPAVGAYSEDDSDPLEDLVGPLPPQKDGPIRPRGRGAYKASGSNIDAHFAPNYDPTLDVAPEDDPEFSTNKPTRRPVSGLMTAEDDWDMALEALRDRQSWKQSGEERLRAAGLNDEVISRWKQNTSVSGAGDPEANLDNFRWAKSGEGREWDRGKVIDSDGHVEVRPTW